jgi:hypothetical protein
MWEFEEGTVIADKKFSAEIYRALWHEEFRDLAEISSAYIRG